MAESQKITSVPDIMLDHRLSATAPEIGQLIEGKGIYVGIWEPKDRKGNSLGKVFNLFAAPEDVQDSHGQNLLLTFDKAVKHVADLQGYYGYGGFNHDARGLTPDEALYEAIRKGDYDGEWFIPPKDALNDNLCKNKDTFKPENAFVTKSNGSDYAHWLWSCTEDTYKSSSVWDQDFTDGGVDFSLKIDCSSKDGVKLSTRLVRAELRLP